uniref:Uncharacterized protein n=1 Tax=Anguilla anguilla TaxID=7936 RepID=A0A0E9WDE8_ANGAN
MGDHTSTGDGGLDERVQLFVPTDGQLQVTRSDALHLQILRGVPRQLQHLSSQVFQNSCTVDGCSAPTRP